MVVGTVDSLRVLAGKHVSSPPKKLTYIMIIN